MRGNSDMDYDLVSKFADEADKLKNVPDSKMEQLATLTRELVTVSAEIDDLDSRIKRAKERKYELETKDLVDLMVDIGIDTTGVDGVSIVVEKKCHANISAEWEDERRLRAFEHLREIGGEDIIKNTLSVSAGRESDEKMQQIHARVTQMLAEVDLQASVKLEPTVAWNTLTAFVRETVDAGETPVDLEAIGATYGSVAKIVKPKKKGK